jgi:SulP family sulfate permease
MENEKLKNKFNLFEWSGAFGDIGMLVPLAFAFVIFNGFSPGKLFLLWGLAYIVTGYYYKVPVSVQPLKAMAVIAIASGFMPHQLSSTAFFYGIIFIVISLTGILRLLQPLFTPAIVRGIQAGIGLILVYKAADLVVEEGLFLGSEQTDPLLSLAIMAALMVVLWYFQFRKKFPLSILIIFGSIIVSLLLGVEIRQITVSGDGLFTASVPDFGFFLTAMVYLVLPQIPLTIGNALFAASDISRQLWKERSQRVNPTKLGYSIGFLNIFIGIFGGFPVCHGAGGMAAHHQFGGRTGGTTMILGLILIVVAVVTPLSRFIFFIPIPVLGALLFITGMRIVLFLKKLKTRKDIAIALLVAAISFATHNLLIAVAAGFAVERILGWLVRVKPGLGRRLTSDK